MAGQISESDQIKQFKEFLGTYNKLTENCFLDCVKDFTSREVRPEEADDGFANYFSHPKNSKGLMTTGALPLFPFTVPDVLRRALLTEVLKNDSEDIDAIPGVSHPAERGVGR
ncbi:UNVERIFIED_CONTAM: hypothetical protein K2H54_015419 [Gekko kuhli]